MARAQLEDDFKSVLEMITNSTPEDINKNFEEAFARADEGLHVRVNFKYLPKALVLLAKGKVEDDKKNFEEALRYYENSVEHFLYALKHEASGDKSKKIIRAKVMLIAERSEQIKDFFRKIERQKRIGDDAPIKYWMDEEKKERKRIKIDIGCCAIC